MDLEGTVSVEPTLSISKPSQHCPQRKHEEELSFKREKRYTQQIQLLTKQCEQAQKNFEKLGEEIRFWKAQVSELYHQLAQRDEQLHMYYQEIVQQLVAEKESNRVHYEHEIVSLQHHLESCSTEYLQYIEASTKERSQLQLQVQQYKHQLQHQASTSVPPKVNKAQSEHLSSNNHPYTYLSTRTNKDPNCNSPSTYLGSLGLMNDGQQVRESSLLPQPLTPQLPTLGQPPSNSLRHWAPKQQGNGAVWHQCGEKTMRTRSAPVTSPHPGIGGVPSKEHAYHQSASQAELFSYGNQQAYQAPTPSYIRTTHTAVSVSQYSLSSTPLHSPLAGLNMESTPVQGPQERDLIPYQRNESRPAQLGKHMMSMPATPPPSKKRKSMAAFSPAGKHMMSMPGTPPPSNKRKSIAAFSPAGGSEMTYDSGVDASPGIFTPYNSISLAGTPYSNSQETPVSVLSLDQLDPSSQHYETDMQINQIAKSKEINIDPTWLDNTCTEDHLLAIAKLIEHYSSYARHLDVTDAELQSIQADKDLTAPHEKPLRLLKTWHKKCAYTERGHYRHFLRGVMEIHTNRKLVGEICKLLRN